ncbi:MAG: tellurium resistance protein TerC [Myxococcota bacterium]
MELLTFGNLVNLLVLLFLQAVLGFDNLLYISIESQRAPEADRARVRRTGILIAIALRVVLLVVMVLLLERLAEPFHRFAWEGVLTGAVSFSTIVFAFGGIFILYTAVKEIHHLLALEDPEEDVEADEGVTKTAGQAIAMIVVMNLVFSFDSILSALAITDVIPVLALAIIGSGIGMMVLADRVSDFIQRNRKYEVLGLFILLIVGVVLLGETGVAAAHATHDEGDILRVFGTAIEPMSKTTFYFSIAVLVAVDVLQSGYQKKLAAVRARAAKLPSAART